MSKNGSCCLAVHLPLSAKGAQWLRDDGRMLAGMNFIMMGDDAEVGLVGQQRSIQHMMFTTFWHPDGTPMLAQQFMEMLFGKLPEFFTSEEELRELWSASSTRAKLLAG